MRTIQANFNARSEDQCILIASREMRAQSVKHGDRVRLTDGAIEVEARIELRRRGPVAVPTWATLEYVDA